MVSSTIDPLGASHPRLEAREKVLGWADFADDLVRPHMLHGCVLGSPYPHARIISCSTERARAVPGVKAVLTAQDIGNQRIGPFVRDETVLAVGTVRYVGEPVAAIAASDIETARAALRLIDIEYAEMPAVFTTDDAMAEAAVILHPDYAAYEKIFDADHAGNILARIEMIEGDTDRAWDQCDVVVEGVFETQAQYHAYMEPCSALAEIDANGRITVWSSNQSVYRVQANVAEGLGIPMSRVRAITPRVGGGFGGKMEATVQPIAAALARATQRPVKVTLSQDQDFETMRARHPTRVHMKTGANRDGTIVAREFDIVLDGGAYADDSPAVAGAAVVMGRGPYRIANVHGTARVVYTNKLRSGAFRGFGNPQITFAGEQQIDEVADALAMDPIELRLQNAIRTGDKFVGGQTMPASGLVECLERVRDAADWKQRRRDNNKRAARRGIGVVCLPHASGLLASGAIVRIVEDGTAILNTGAVDIGQGSDTVLAQMCASALGLGLEQVVFAQPDTDAGVFNWGTAASRTTFTTGLAVAAAADDVVGQLKHYAAEIMECAAQDVELRPGGRIGLAGISEKEVSFKDISARCHWVSGGPIIGSHTFVFDGERFDPKRAIIKGLALGNIGGWIFAAQIIEVEVDEATGRVVPLNVWSAHDLGRAVNPIAVEGQVEGGVMQGFGYALTEEMVWDAGRLANPSLMDYRVPGASDFSCPIHTILVESNDPTGPFGAKGVGEPPLIGVAPAIANAIHDAVGVRLRRLPMTAEQLLSAMREGHQV